MKLKGDLFNIIRSCADDGQLQCAISLNQDCEIYRGHFPGNPITPGVVMIGIARELMETALEKKLKLDSAASVKYTSILSPSEHGNVEYNISYQLVDNIVRGKVTVADGETTFARMSLTWIQA